MADKTKNLRVGLPEVNLKKESKYHPPAVPDRPSNQNGDGHEFNIKGKVTSMGGAYHDPTPGSGAGGNWADKDASQAYLRARGAKGQRIENFTGGQMHGREHTGEHGQSIYPTSPIPQVYKRATGHNDTTDPAEKKYS